MRKTTLTHAVWASLALLPALLLLSCLPAQAQTRFINLTADEVEIDSVLPYFGYSQRLGDNYADSVYAAEIAYPEFYDMSREDIEAYMKITDMLPPAMPEVDCRWRNVRGAYCAWASRR